MKTLFFIATTLLLSATISAQHHDERYVPETDPLVLEKLDHWQDVKFGLLMHWGPYSQWGVVESWSICAEDEGWCRRKTDNYMEYKKQYEALQTTFNPVKFFPDKWAKAAKKAGMKYVVFTTKHHDGFCMFDTQYTDYKITGKKCPFNTHPKANITKEIFDAFRNQGMMVGAYFSKPDWHNENYWWPNFATPDRNVNYDPETYPERWNNFTEFTHNQIMELMTNYGNIDILWLDGGWVAKLSKEEIDEYYKKRRQESGSGFLKSRVISQDIKMDELVQKCREQQPGLIVVDRAVYGKNQNYLTPENRVPEKTLPYPWESCIISGGGWSFTPNAKYMNPRDAVHMLIDIVAKGGNLLLNVAPGPDGEWQEGAYNLLKAYGEWMNINSEAIYNSKPVAPYKEGKICMTQQEDGTTCFIYMADKGETTLPQKITIDSHYPVKGAKVSLLGAKGHLKWEANGNGCVIYIPEKIQKNVPCNYAWTIKVSSIQ